MTLAKRLKNIAKFNKAYAYHCGDLLLKTFFNYYPDSGFRKFGLNSSGQGTNQNFNFWGQVCVFSLALMEYNSTFSNRFETEQAPEKKSEKFMKTHFWDRNLVLHNSLCKYKTTYIGIHIYSSTNSHAIQSLRFLLVQKKIFFEIVRIF